MNKTDIRKQFFYSLKRGRGEAYLLMKQYPEIDFSTYIQKAIVKNYAYDGQCENSRADYLFSLYQLSDKKEKIREAVFTALQTETQDTWTLTQLFGFAKILAQHGDKQAKCAIYERFGKKIIVGSDWVGSAEILALDGFEGLKFIAETFGKLLEKNPDDRQDDQLISDLQMENKEIDVVKELEKAAKQNKYIQIYLDNVRKTVAGVGRDIGMHRLEATRKEKPKDIIAFIKEEHPYFIKQRGFNDAELEQIALHFLQEKDRKLKAQFLSVFTEFKYPFDYHDLLESAKGKLHTNWRFYNIDIARFAAVALKFFQGKDIRDFAIEKLKTAKKDTYIYLNLLISNYQKGDDKLLNEIINLADDGYFIDYINYGIRDIYKKNPVSECKIPLENLYRKINNSYCRTAIIKVLIKNNALSDEILRAMEFDCNEDTRKLFAEQKKKK